MHSRRNEANSAFTSSEGGGLIVLTWWTVSTLLHHAHQHHEPLLTFLAHSIKSWLDS